MRQEEKRRREGVRSKISGECMEGKRNRICCPKKGEKESAAGRAVVYDSGERSHENTLMQVVLTWTIAGLGPRLSLTPRH